MTVGHTACPRRAMCQRVHVARTSIVERSSSFHSEVIKSNQKQSEAISNHLNRGEELELPLDGGGRRGGRPAAEKTSSVGRFGVEAPAMIGRDREGSGGVGRDRKGSEGIGRDRKGSKARGSNRKCSDAIRHRPK